MKASRTVCFAPHDAWLGLEETVVDVSPALPVPGGTWLYLVQTFTSFA